jgi:hypothetical protein
LNNGTFFDNHYKLHKIAMGQRISRNVFLTITIKPQGGKATMQRWNGWGDESVNMALAPEGLKILRDLIGTHTIWAELPYVAQKGTDLASD